MSTEPRLNPAASTPPTDAEIVCWRRIEAWLDRLLDLAQPERATVLHELAQQAPDLLDEVLRLLARSNEDAPLLQRSQQSVWQILESSRYAAAHDHDDAQPELSAGTVIGPYALVRELGRGGMGAVWLARRVDGQLEREVALKLPHHWLMASVQRHRFMRERNILAALNHPHIATLYDAGVATIADTHGGAGEERPWLALEYVEGQRIDRWCSERKASVSERIALMQQVIAAVQYAHSRLVIHRDLKPANILVTANGTVKLLDFGIAKLMTEAGDGTPDDAERHDNALTRHMGQAVTPDYASPEQLLSEPITTATDVYTLGMVLYELLCGKRPYPEQGKSLHERLQIAQNRARESPPLASSRIDGDAAATAFGINAKALRAELRGDLDAVLNKALAWNPQARYPSVEALQRDLERYSQHLPVSAHRINRLALAGKFVRRHRLGVSFATALLLAIGIGTAGVWWQAQRTEEQAHIAEAQARRAEKTKDFLVSLFRTVDPRIASDTPHDELTMKAVLDRNSDRIEREFGDDPVMQVELLGMVSELYARMGDEVRYEPLRARHLALAREHLGPYSEPILSDAVSRAARHCERLLADCAVLQQQADELLTAAGQQHGEQRAEWWAGEWVRLRGDSTMQTQATASLQKALDYHEQSGQPSSAWVSALVNMGTDLYVRNQSEPAIERYQRALALSRRLPLPDEAEQAVALTNLGIVYSSLGRYREAAAVYDQSLALRLRTDGELAKNPSAWGNVAESAELKHLAGDRAQAMTEFSKLITLLPSHDERRLRERTYAVFAYAGSLVREGRGAQAIDMLEALETVYSQHRKAFPFSLRLCRSVLGAAYAQAGRRIEARRRLQLALDEYIAHERPGNQSLMNTRERWGRFLLGDNDAEAAAAQFHAIIDNAEGRKLSFVALAHGGLARVALVKGDRVEALNQSAQALDLWHEKAGYYDVRMLPYLQRIRADALAANNDYEAAQKLEDEAWKASQQYDAPESPTTQRRVLRH